MRCIECGGESIKKGKVKGIQRYRCTVCGRFFQSSYTRPNIEDSQYCHVAKLNNEGRGISSIARLLQISKSSVQRILISLAKPKYEEGENQNCGTKKKGKTEPSSFKRPSPLGEGWKWYPAAAKRRGVKRTARP